MTTNTMTYGTYEHGRAYYERGTHFRRDQYTNHDTGETAIERLFAAHSSDDSPIWTGNYSAKCSCCYLGFAHTSDYHRAATE